MEKSKKVKLRQNHFVALLFCSFVILFTLHSSLFTLNAQPPEVEKLFDKAAEEYLSKNWTDAISDLKKVIAVDPGNSRALGLLGRAFTSRAAQLKEEGKLEEALSHADEAIKYSPDLQDAHNLKTSIEKAIEKRDAGLVESRKRKEYADQRKQEEERLREKMQADYSEKIEDEKRQREQRETKLIEEIEKSKKEVLQRKEEIEILRQQTRIISTRWFIIFTIAVLIVIAVAYLISSKIVTEVAFKMRGQIAESDDKIGALMVEFAKKSADSAGIAELKKANEEIMREIAAGRSNPMEEKLVAQTENLIKVVESGFGKNDGKTETIEFDEKKPRIAITDISPVNRARAKSVVSISKTVNNPALAARLIAPYLKDTNNRVKAQAAVEMFKYDPESSENAIKGMVASDDKWMRSSAAWAIGEIADLSLMSSLEVLIQDYDSLVKERAIDAAKKAADVLKTRFPATLRIKIQRKI